jgi:hypothetical protein
MNKTARTTLQLIALLFAAFALLSCQNPLNFTDEKIGFVDNDGNGNSDNPDNPDDPDGGQDGVAPIQVKGESFTLAWNPPQDGSVTGYRLYFRTHGDQNWSELEQVDAGTTEYTVNHPELDYGQYDFAVTSLDSGDESDYHSSLDETAQPSGGWYMEWQQS